jgi:hypothetical protein
MVAIQIRRVFAYIRIAVYSSDPNLGFFSKMLRPATGIR